MKKIFPTRKKGISFLSKKWILAICLVSIAGNTPATQPPKSGKAYVVSNAHMDTQWLWTVQTSIIDYIPRTIYQNLALIRDYPNYIFNFEGAVKYNWMKEYYPLDYEKVKEAIKKREMARIRFFLGCQRCKCPVSRIQFQEHIARTRIL